MSDSQDEADIQSHEPAETPAGGSGNAPPEPRRRSVWPWFFLILVLLGAGAGGTWGWMQYQKLQQQNVSLLNVEDRLSEAEAQLAVEAALGERLTELETLLDEQRRVSEEQLQLLQDQLAATKLELESLAGEETPDRSQWLMAEAAYYMRVANAQMSLAGNAAMASRALGMADEKLRLVGDPRLTPVRRAISEEVAELNALPQADIEGVILALDALGRRLPGLPLKQQVPDRFDGRESGPEASASGLARAWESIKAAFSSLVRIRPSDTAPESLASPSQELLLLRGVEAEISIAKLAYLQGQGRVFQAAMDETVRRLSLHFDVENPEVRSALETLEEIGDADISPVRPDISGSLGLLMELDPRVAAP